MKNNALRNLSTRKITLIITCVILVIFGVMFTMVFLFLFLAMLEGRVEIPSQDIRRFLIFLGVDTPKSVIYRFLISLVIAILGKILVTMGDSTSHFTINQERKV